MKICPFMKRNKNESLCKAIIFALIDVDEIEMRCASDNNRKDAQNGKLETNV